MQRLLITLLALLVVAVPAAEARPRAAVAVETCHPSLDPELRLAAFEGTMRRIEGAERMQMRFTLQQRTPTAPRWSGVAAESWGQWLTSDPGVAEYRYTREVGRLAAPAAYRTVVKYRWLDAAGKVVARRRAVSRACHQPDLRPNLKVTEILYRDGGYRVRLRNSGRTRAAASALDLTIDGRPVRLQAPAIKPLDARVVTVSGPRCTDEVSALADAADAVDERDEADNGLTVACPLARRR